MADTWTAVIGRLGAPTGDGRVIAPGGFTVRTLPLPLRWQEEDDEAHEKAKTIGRIDTVTVDPVTGLINATGVLLDPAVFDDVIEVAELIRNGIVYPSMDAGKCDYVWQVTGGGEGYWEGGQYQEAQPYSEMCTFTEYECAAVTLVAIQAFADLRITLDTGMLPQAQPAAEPMPAAITASVRSGGWSSMPVADAGTKWDSTAAAKRVLAWATSGDTTDWKKYSKAFLYQDDQANAETEGAYGFGIADVIGGQLELVPKGVYSAAGVLNGAMGGTKIPQADQDAMKTVLGKVYKHLASALGDDTITAPFALLAAARSAGWSSMPVAPADTTWDAQAASDAVLKWATDGGKTDWKKYAKAFLWQDPNANAETKGAYKLPVATVMDGHLQIVPKGVYRAAGALSGSRGGLSIPQADQDRLKGIVRGIYRRMAKALNDKTITAPFALTASGAPLPPRDWFTDPKLTELTPITIDGDGRVFGHAAPWGVCHIGLPGCVTAPASFSGYAYFMTGATLTSEGAIPTGKLTVGGGHADGALGFAAAAEHYDNVGTAVATVIAGEDEFGIWVAGSVIADATPEQVEALRQSPLSGDWRDIGGNLELVAAHAVNTPGFPVPRARAMVADGRQLSLVAAGVPQKAIAPASASAGVDVAQLASQLAPMLARSLGVAILDGDRGDVLTAAVGKADGDALDRAATKLARLRLDRFKAGI